ENPRTTTAIEPMTQKAINNLIPQRVIEAPAECETQRNSVVNGDTSHTTRTGPRTVRATRECTYKDYLNYGPLKFKGTEGVIGLTQWFERTESVSSISDCPTENQVKFASCTLIRSALTWWNSYIRAVSQKVAYVMPWKTLRQMMTAKNQRNQNQAGNGNTVARAYGVGTAKGNPDANVVTDKSEEKRLEDVPIVRDFSEVFPKDLPGLPLTRQVEFQIDLIPSAAPVARAHYRLALFEMKELSDQLQELSDKEAKDFVAYCDASHKGLGAVLMQREKLELLSDYDCEIRYHTGKANVVADALSKKERIKPLRVRALVMTIGLDLPKQILRAQTEAKNP
nr:reverse transcriptase domain-containing protein [Tanacetum cinerariifolium]